MTEQKEKKSSKNVLLLLVIFSIPILIGLSLLFVTVIGLSPFVGVVYIFYSFFEMINKLHKRKTLYKHNMQQLKYENDL
jgi:polyferredoxin